MKRKTILDHAEEIHELWVSLENISHDDRCSIADYSVSELVAEAKYVLSCFHEGGHVSNEELTGDHGTEAQASARKQVKLLHKFIGRYDRR